MKLAPVRVRKPFVWFSEKLFGNQWHRLLDDAKRREATRFLLFWNRGLGDIALGLYQVIAEIRERIIDAEITVVTRPELAEAFELLPVDWILVDKSLTRGEKQAAQRAFERLTVNPAEYDAVLDRIDPTRWFAGTTPRLQPKLSWASKFDALSHRFEPFFYDAGESCLIIGAHVQSETGAFYGYRKDWPTESWRALFARSDALPPVRFVLFGHRSDVDFEGVRCIDLRGQTSFLEMIALIKNRCRILIAPDSGVLTMSYYLDAPFRLDAISLWADSRQGILKLGVSSPNPQLRHIPLLGADESVENISVDQVFDAVSMLVPGSRPGHKRATQSGGQARPVA